MCIDQRSNAERSHQVQLMGSIYGAARGVIVWLGQLEPSIDVLWVVNKFIPAILSLYSSRGRVQLRPIYE